MKKRKCKFTIGDRVTTTSRFVPLSKGSGDRIGTIVDITENFVFVMWDEYNFRLATSIASANSNYRLFENGLQFVKRRLNGDFDE